MICKIMTANKPNLKLVLGIPGSRNLTGLLNFFKKFKSPNHLPCLFKYILYLIFK